MNVETSRCCFSALVNNCEIAFFYVAGKEKAVLNTTTNPPHRPGGGVLRWQRISTSRGGNSLPDHVKRVRTALETWQSPSHFEGRVAGLDEQIKSSELFRANELKFMRDDAWILARFAVLVRAESVRLGTEKEEAAGDDGFVKVSGDCLQIQIIEADREDRKRGDEYNPGACKLTCEQTNDAEYVAAALKRAIDKKIDKHQTPPPTLVVNVNLGVHGNKEQEAKLKLLIAALKERFSSDFPAGIYVLWNDMLI
jgi:hypothetical protein